jgi:hypothetical protein
MRFCAEGYHVRTKCTVGGDLVCIDCGSTSSCPFHDHDGQPRTEPTEFKKETAPQARRKGTKR